MSSPKRSSKRIATSDTARIGFIGAGRLATAIINGLVAYGKIDPKRIFVAAPSVSNSENLKLTHKGLRTTKRNIDIFGRFDCDIVFLCITPNVIRNLYKMGGTKPAALTTNYIPNMRHPVYVLSMIFGFNLNQLKECLLNPENPNRYMVKFHRCVMSCTAAYAIGYCWIDVEPDSPQLPDLVRKIINLIAKIEYLPENQMDAACSIVGAGLSFVTIAFFAYLIPSKLFN